MNITNRVIECYINCKYKAALALRGDSGHSHEYELLMNELRERYEPVAMASLLRRCKVERELPSPTLTTAILKQGHRLLTNPLIDQHPYEVRIDAICRTDGNSRLGRFHYAPVLFVHEEAIGEQYKRLLACQAVLVGQIQEKLPAFGLCVSGPTCKLTKINLTRRTSGALVDLEYLEQMSAGTVNQRLRLNRHCDVCEFQDSCKTEAIAIDDISRLRTLSDAEIQRHNSAGIFTVTHLSYTYRPKRRSSLRTQRGTRRQSALQALAIREQKVFVLDSPSLPVAPVHVYADFEGGQSGHHAYLLGGIISSEVQERAFSFWSDDDTSQQDIMDKFLQDLSALGDFVFFHYGSYEIDILKAARHDQNAHLIDCILSKSCNILSVIYRHFYFPTYSNSLKDIGSLLGAARSSPIQSGSQSLYWRHRFEADHDAKRKEALILYNHEDCAALQRITQFLLSAVSQQRTGQSSVANSRDLPNIATVNEVFRKTNWNPQSTPFPDFDYINKCAYFDYQREHVFVRTNKRLRKQQRKRNRNRKTSIRVNKEINLATAECPECGGTRFVNHARRRSKLALDLVVTSSGIKRHVTRVTAPKQVCQECGLIVIATAYERLDTHGHALKSWAMYQHIVHRVSTHRLEEMCRDVFGLPLFAHDFVEMKCLLSAWYQDTYSEIMAKLKAGALIHADETPVRVKTGKGYVWVLAGLEEVVYIYRPNREGGFLSSLLGGFEGVLVSDFYKAYDSLPCPQQKCLVHFIRDMNSDLLKNPFDEEFKAFVSEFSGLMRAIVATIDSSGLRYSALRKHRRAAHRLVRQVINGNYRSGVMKNYQGRLKRYGGRMFTFLGFSGVPWNNAHAEHAVRRFAYYRDMSSGYLTVEGLEAYLVLLSISQTCECKGVRFLDFLLSQEKSIDGFLAKKRRKRVPPVLNMYPHGICRWGKKAEQAAKQRFDKRIRIVFLKKSGKSIPAIMDEVGVTRRQVERTLAAAYFGKRERKSPQ